MNKYQKKGKNNKKFKPRMKTFGGKFSESKNLKILQSMFKIVQDKVDKKNIVYTDKSKTSLIEYIIKEDPEPIENKDISECDLNHLIISPVHPILYDDLDEEEKLLVQEQSKEWVKKEFKKYGFISGIEQNSDKSQVEGEEKLTEGFHIHIGINKQFGEDIKGSWDLLQIRESMTNHMSNKLPQEIREKLGIKSTIEIKRISKKNKEIAKQKRDIREVKQKPEYKENNKAINQLNKGLTNIFKELDIKNTERNQLTEFNHRERYNIKSKKEGLQEEIEYINKGIISRNKDSKLIDDNIKENETLLSTEEQIFNNELKSLQSFFKNKSESLSHYVNNEHSLFKKILKDSVKKGEIDNAMFMSQVSDNKKYWKNIEEDERISQELELENKRKDFKLKIESIQRTIEGYQSNKDFLDLLNEHDMSKLNAKLSDMDYLNNETMNLFDTFSKRMEVIDKEMKDLQIKSKIMKIQSKNLSNINQNMIEQVIQMNTNEDDNIILDDIMNDISSNVSLKINCGNYQDGDTINEEEKLIKINTKNRSDIVIYRKTIEMTMKITGKTEEEIIENFNTDKILTNTKVNIINLTDSIIEEDLININDLQELLKYYEEHKDDKNDNIEFETTENEDIELK